MQYITVGLECVQLLENGRKEEGIITDIFMDDTFIVESNDYRLREYSFDDIGKKVFFDSVATTN